MTDDALAATDATGDLPLPDHGGIDANCDECVHQQREQDPDAEKRDAVTWIEGTDAVRRYLCSNHASDLLRFETRPSLGVEEASAPTAERCRGCGTWTLSVDLADPARKKCPDCAEAR